MDTNSTAAATAPTRTMSQATRAITTALCAAAFVLVLAFGAPDDQSSRWDGDIDAHSDVAHEVAFEGNIFGN